MFSDSVISKAIAIVLTFLAAEAVSAVAQEQPYKGWPGHDGISDLKAAFADPPRGYGNVPFYWWTGDPLNIDRLKEQLEILSDASTDGLCVSYNHTHDKVDVELNAAGHGPCGRVSGGEPRVMSEEWWRIWNEFSSLCAEKGVGLGMDDYVIAWPKNGEFIDSILAKPGISGYQGRLKVVRTSTKANCSRVIDEFPFNRPFVPLNTPSSARSALNCNNSWSVFRGMS